MPSPPPRTGPGQCSRFRQENLASAEEREQRRAYWQRTLDQVAAALNQR
ncbi:hypothetical protein [Streptomyces sp. NPDC006368]